jgi:hypothetical protein
MLEETTNIPTPANMATTLHDAVVESVCRQIELKGLDEAMKDFGRMNEFFSMAPDWPQIANEVYSIFAAKKSQEKQAEADHQQELEKAWIGAISKHGFAQANLLTGNNATSQYNPLNKKGDNQQ